MSLAPLDICSRSGLFHLLTGGDGECVLEFEGLTFRHWVRVSVELLECVGGNRCLILQFGLFGN